MNPLIPSSTLRTATAALVCLLAGGYASAQDKKPAIVIPEGKAMAQPSQKVGQKGPAAVEAKFIKNSLYWVKDDKPDVIVQFINDMGCAGAQGARAAVTTADFKKIAEDTAKNTEMLYVPSDKFLALTGDPKAFAAGMTHQIKAVFASENGYKLGDPKKNSILLRGDPPPANYEPPDGGTGALTIAHELLHIVLRQINNVNLGGGDKVADTGVSVTGQSGSGKDIKFGEYSNNHHHLTDALGWKQVSWNQSTKAWTARAPHLDCDAAFEATAKESAADKTAATPKAQP